MVCVRVHLRVSLCALTVICVCGVVFDLHCVVVSAVHVCVQVCVCVYVLVVCEQCGICIHICPAVAHQFKAIDTPRTWSRGLLLCYS